MVGMWLAKDIWDKDIPGHLAAPFTTIVVAILSWISKLWNLF